MAKTGFSAGKKELRIRRHFISLLVSKSCTEYGKKKIIEENGQQSTSIIAVKR